VTLITLAKSYTVCPEDLLRPSRLRKTASRFIRRSRRRRWSLHHRPAGNGPVGQRRPRRWI